MKLQTNTGQMVGIITRVNKMGNVEGKQALSQAMKDIQQNNFTEFDKLYSANPDHVLAVWSLDQLALLDDFQPVILKILEKIEQVLEQGESNNKNLYLSLTLLKRVISVSLEEHETADQYWADGENSLGPLILNTLDKLLFFPGFSTPCSHKDLLNDTELGSVFSWSSGIGTEDFEDSRRFDQNRIAVVDCLIACFSQSIYVTPQHIRQNGIVNPWVAYFTSLQTPNTKAFLLSLLNIAIRYDPIGWGIPYNHGWAPDTNERFMNDVIRLLCILLEIDTINENIENVYINLLKSFFEEHDFSPMANFFQRVLGNHRIANHTWIPGSTKKLYIHQEAVVLLWRVLETSEIFFDWFLNQDVLLDVVISLCYFINQGKNDISHHGFVGACIYLLFYLSGSRQFSVQLNKPFTGKLYTNIKSKNCNHADIVIEVLVNVIKQGDDNLKPLWETALIIIDNLSPFVSSINKEVCRGIMSIFHNFSKPKFIVSNERNYIYCTYLFEIFNNILQYQYTANYDFAYSLMVNQEKILKLHNSTYEDYVNYATEGNFVPTEEWYITWKESIPFETSLCYISSMAKEIKKIVCTSAEDEQIIMDYLHKTTIVGLLPPPHPVTVHRYTPNPGMSERLHVFMWGAIFVSKISLYRSEKLKLFKFFDAK
eukprot:TRINITY_DN7560_c0_g1_i2.p1 TRINITY_DN7560_c0_g1~~TRINITY_DN7560_c0_g1_i2.p1  ORF type:complete len:654 (-),score=102.92 TRINITY_DN7560_c0_g1_i2:1674-3635(-)